jgi:hypothetical protein
MKNPWSEENDAQYFICDGSCVIRWRGFAGLAGLALPTFASHAMWRRKKKSPDKSGLFFDNCWRREPESNRPKRLCRPLHNRFAIAP